MKKFKQNLIIAALGLALFASPSSAADFTLTVPIEATGLPEDAKEMITSCQIFSDGSPPIVGAASKTTVLTTNSFSGQVVVSINASPSVDPALARRYRCFVWFQTQHRTGIPDRYYYTPFGSPDGVSRINFATVPGSIIKLDTGTLPIP